MISANRKLVALAALVPALAAGPAAQAAHAPAPRLEAVALTTAPDVGKDLVAVAFRTDVRLGRKANGRSLDGRVVVLQTGSASISTLRGGSSCYVAYTDRGHLKLGRRYAVQVDLGKAAVTRKLVLRRGGTAAAARARIGC